LTFVFNTLTCSPFHHEFTGSEKEPTVSDCPICGRKFVEIYYEGVHPVVPPDQPYEGLVEFGDWFEVKTIPELERYEPYKFEYASTRDLDEILKGIELTN